MRVRLTNVVNELKVILHPGGQMETEVMQSTLALFQKYVECPFDWGFTEMKDKPPFLDSLKTKTFHLVGEGYLRPFLLRLMMTVEMFSRGSVLSSVEQFELSVGLLLNGLEREQIPGGMEQVAMHVLFAAAAKMFLLRGYFIESFNLLSTIIIKAMTKRDLAIVSCMKATICTYYGMEGMMAALEHAVDARGSPVLEVEWRFVFVQLMSDLYDVNLGERVIRTTTRHMEVSWTSETNKPTTSFAKFYRIIFKSKAKRTALLEMQGVLDRLTGDCAGAPDMKTMELQVIRALEVDPLNSDLLTKGAFYFILTNEMHKALTLYWIGRSMYRRCAEGLYDLLTQLFPFCSYLDVDDILRYYSPEGSLLILKRASVYLLGCDRSQALALASKVLRLEARVLPQLREAGLPMEIGGQQASFGYHELMGSVAYSIQGSPEADTYIGDMDRLLHPSLHPAYRGAFRQVNVLVELDQLLQLANTPKIPLAIPPPYFVS